MCMCIYLYMQTFTDHFEIELIVRGSRDGPDLGVRLWRSEARPDQESFECRPRSTMHL